jgi:predicted transcriptional regulator
MAVTALGLERFGDVKVSEVMTTELIWVHRTAALREVAQRMLDEEVHRVLVMDDKRQLYGIVAAYDMVRVVAEGSN